MIPMNLMKNGKAVYIETGAWSKKAIKEAQKVGEVIVAASSKDKNYTYVPDCSDLEIPEDTDYVYICENETIHGVTWNKLPNYVKATGGNVIMATNGDFYNMQNAQPNGYLIMEGNVIQENNGATSEPYFAVLKDGTYAIRDAGTDCSDVLEAVSGPCYLVKDGQIVA